MTLAVDLQKRVQDVVHQLTVDWPAGTAAIWNKPVRYGGIQIRIEPAKENRAPISIFVEDGYRTITLWIGRSTVIELVVSNDEEASRDLVEVLQSVISGTFSEQVWTVDGSVVKCLGRLRLSGKWATYRYFGGTSAFLRRRVKVEYQYKPYVA